MAPIFLRRNEMSRELMKPIPLPTPEYAKALSPEERARHRDQIAREVRAVLSAYFQPHENDAIRVMQLAWWCDELEDWTLDQIVWALRSWNRGNPRLRPTPGDIVGICKQERGRRLAPKVPENQSETRGRVSREAAAEIMRRAGYLPRGAS